jgi:hypothetical protein
MFTSWSDASVPTAATPVAKVVRGEDSGGLPVEQPTKIVPAINLRIAEQIELQLSTTGIMPVVAYAPARDQTSFPTPAVPA